MAQSPLFAVDDVTLDAAGDLTVGVPVTPANYYLLFRIDPDGGSGTAVDAALPAGNVGAVVLRDHPATGLRSAFYRAKRIPISAPEDTDGDGIDDLFELRHPLLLSPIDPSDAAEDGDEDGESNLSEYLAGADPAEVITTEIAFVTSDNITIRGAHRRPAARPGRKLPMVVLIHQGFRTRSEWDPFLAAFSAAGYATIAYDIRGHGQSGGSFSSADFDDPNTSPRDVVAALAFARSLPTTNAERVGIVGSSVGGNLACVASQNRWVKTAVNISGKTSAVRNLAAVHDPENDLDLQSMFHIASASDGGGQRAFWANKLFDLTSGSRRVEIVPGSSAHGLAVFDAAPSLLDRVIDWLAETL